MPLSYSLASIHTAQQAAEQRARRHPMHHRPRGGGSAEVHPSGVQGYPDGNQKEARQTGV